MVGWFDNLMVYGFSCLVVLGFVLLAVWFLSACFLLDVLLGCRFVCWCFVKFGILVSCVFGYVVRICGCWLDEFWCRGLGSHV